MKPCLSLLSVVHRATARPQGLKVAIGDDVAASSCFVGKCVVCVLCLWESFESLHISTQNPVSSAVHSTRASTFASTLLACRHKQANRTLSCSTVLVCYTATMAACATGYGLNDSMKKLYKEVSVQLQMLQLLGLLTHMPVEVAVRFAGR